MCVCVCLSASRKNTDHIFVQVLPCMDKEEQLHFESNLFLDPGLYRIFVIILSLDKEAAPYILEVI